MKVRKPTMINLADDAMTIKLDYELPEYPKFEEGYRRAPRRESHLTEAYRLMKFLRYIHTIKEDQIPPTSLLREFLGGSSFEY